MSHYTNQNASNPNAVLAHARVGAPVASPQGHERNDGRIKPAGLLSTAPYKPPKRRAKDNPNKILCPVDDCKAFPTKATGYCVGHSKKMGLAGWDDGRGSLRHDNAD